MIPFVPTCDRHKMYDAAIEMVKDAKEEGIGICYAFRFGHLPFGDHLSLMTVEADHVLRFLEAHRTPKEGEVNAPFSPPWPVAYALKGSDVLCIEFAESYPESCKLAAKSLNQRT